MQTRRRGQSAIDAGTAAVPRLLTLVLALGLLFAFAGTAGAAWKGQVVDKNGVPHVMNPAEPMEAAMDVTLQELWRLGGETDDEDEFFGVINRITTDAAGNVYILDNQLTEVKIYDAAGNFVRSIGREGEGPGEFRAPVDMFLTVDDKVAVVQVAPGRIVLLTKEGEPAGEQPLPKDEGGTAPFLIGGKRFGQGLLLAAMTNKFEEGKFEQTRFLAMVKPDGTETGRVHSDVRALEFANAVFEERQWDTFDRRWEVGPDGKLYACIERDPYKINIYDAGGTLTRVIERQYERVARDQSEMDYIQGIFEAFTRQIPNAKVKVENTYKDVETLHPRTDGSLWVLTSKGMHRRPDGALGTFDVFNKEGQFVRQVTLKGEGNPQEDAYFFVGDRVYVVTGFLSAAMAAQGGATEENEDEDAAPMAVICYKLDVPNMGM